MKEEREWKNDEAFPTLPNVSSTRETLHYCGDDDFKLTSTTQTKKASFTFCKLTSNVNELEVTVRDNINKSTEDDMLTISSSSHEVYFSSNNYESEEDLKGDIKKVSRTALRMEKKQGNLECKTQHDIGLDKLIMKIKKRTHHFNS